MPILFDIDMDFFFNNEKTIVEDGAKKLWMHPDRLLSLCPPQADLFVEHADALAVWHSRGLRHWTCWHFDAHADMGLPDEPSPEYLPPGMRCDFVNSGNFLYVALREEVFAHVVWVLPPWLDQAFARENLAHLPAHMRARITCVPWTAQLPRADSACISFSPAFTPFSALAKLGNFLQPDKADGFVESIISHKCRLLSWPIPQYRGKDPNASAGMLYHGSSAAWIKTLRGEPLYLSPSPAVALGFALPLDNAAGWIHGVDPLFGQLPYIIAPKGLETALNEPGSLYRVRNPGCKPIGSLVGMEFATEKSAAVLEEIRFENVGAALRDMGVYIATAGQKNLSPKIAKLVEEMADSVTEWLEMPLDAILALEPLEPLLLVYLAANKKLAGNEIHAIPFAIWRKILDRVLLPICAPFILRPESAHGLEHARQTALYAGILAWLGGQDPLAPMLAGCLHDAARQNDSGDIGHEANSAELARLVARNFPALFPAPGATSEIVAAIRHHSETGKTDSPIGACLRDADRLPLAWEAGAKPDLFSLEAGYNLAKSGLAGAENLRDFISGLGNEERHSFECKIEITDACNLCCPFCHQNFGARKGLRQMPLGEFSRWLDICAVEKIGMLRITGGEPLVARNFGSYLRLAKEYGFYITLNSNATLLSRKTLEAIAPFVDCLKISFPAPDEASTAAILGRQGVWESKLEAAAFAASAGIYVELLTPMFPAAIERIHDFGELFAEVGFLRWRPLRAEATPGDSRPVSRRQMLNLLKGIESLRKMERFADLQLGLSVPFCLLADPWRAASLLSGRMGCGPLDNVAINPEGKVMRCYSRRSAMNLQYGLRGAAMLAALEDFQNLPAACRLCPALNLCLGGCRAPQSLTRAGFDYLAMPGHARQWRRKFPEFALA